MFEPERMKPIEEEADSLLDKLKASNFTALIVIAGAALIIIGLIVS